VIEPPNNIIEAVKEEESINDIVTKADEEPPVSSPKNEDVVEKPKASRKMVTCPDCGKTMLEKNFRYQHINVCGKVRIPKPRAKPIEDVIKEKKGESNKTRAQTRACSIRGCKNSNSTS
jgi:ssDNA-binding Zn-finger/Zn-ribbon topoisomerase 1